MRARRAVDMPTLSGLPDGMAVALAARRCAWATPTGAATVMLTATSAMDAANTARGSMAAMMSPPCRDLKKPPTALTPSRPTRQNCVAHAHLGRLRAPSTPGQPPRLLMVGSAPQPWARRLLLAALPGCGDRQQRSAARSGVPPIDL